MSQENDISDFLEHYGVKGMKWGVRKDRDSASRYSSVKEALARNPSPKLSKEQRQNIVSNQKRHDAKFDSSEAEDDKGWRPTKKQLAFVAIGALATAAVIYKIKSGKSIDIDVGAAFSIEDYQALARNIDTPNWMSEYANTQVSIDEFKGLVSTSVGRVWTGNYVTPDLFSQKETTFSAGHEFFRLSHVVEKSFGDATFMVSDKEDLARYFLGWKDSTTNVINFKATDTIRVPDLYTRLEAMREALVNVGDREVTPKTVMDTYSNLSGSSFNTPRGKAFLDVLKAKGYHAIVDDMDAGVYGRMPLVLIDPTKVSSKVTTLNQNVDTGELMSLLKEIPNRR